MAYQMHYDNHQIIHTVPLDKKKPRGKKILIFVAVALLIGLLFIPEVRQLLIPGDADITKAAADEMIDRLRSGEGVAEAFAQFCLEIIQNG